MKFIRGIKNKIIFWQYSRIDRLLSSISPEKIVSVGERNLLKAFHHAAKHVPAYKKFLNENGVDPKEITSIQRFKATVPFVDKNTVFPSNELREVCTGGNFDDVSSFYSSSGHSGVFSYGAETWNSKKKTALGLEFLLDTTFQIFQKKTLLINCLPMGVKITTRTVPVADTSVRADVIYALIKKLSSDFDQFILIGESPFLKKVIEEGTENGINWHKLIVNIVTGAEFIAENYRSYMGHLMGIDFDDPEHGMIGINMGLSELSLSIFSENFQTIRIRRMAHENRSLRYALFGEGTEVCPLIMQYYPQQTFIETMPDENGRSELVVSMLGNDLKIPLIRYKTGDVVQIMEFVEVKKILKDFGYRSMLPRYHLPFGIIKGKNQKVELCQGETISPDEIKQALYQNYDIAGKVTGNFRIYKENKGATLLIQLKNQTKPLEDMNQSLSAYIKEYVKSEIQIKFIPYLKFPYGLEHNYEKKNQYV